MSDDRTTQSASENASGAILVSPAQAKAAITLKLSFREMKVLEELAEKKELTKVAVIRQALRLYQLLDARLAQGEKLLVEDAAGAKTTELMML
nr:transcriptional regulator [Nitrosomonas nitrosa]